MGAANAAPSPSPELIDFCRGLGLPQNHAGDYTAALLLWQHCTDAQRLEVMQIGQLTIHGSNGGLYRVYAPAPPIGIDHAGSVTRFCISPRYGEEVVPQADMLLTHKLMLESDEKAWRSIANRL